MTERESEVRYFRAVVLQEVLFAHTGTDEEVISHAQLIGAHAVDGLMAQHPDVHFVAERLELAELTEGHTLEVPTENPHSF